MMMTTRPLTLTHRTNLKLSRYRRRTFSTNQLPRPPPKPLPPPETFSSTSRPRQYYSRPHPGDLPPYRVSFTPSPPLLTKKKPPRFLFLTFFTSASLAWFARDMYRWRRRVGRVLGLRSESRTSVELRDASCAQRVARERGRTSRPWRRCST
jgi:hypothetical protein